MSFLLKPGYKKVRLKETPIVVPLTLIIFGIQCNYVHGWLTLHSDLKSPEQPAPQASSQHSESSGPKQRVIEIVLSLFIVHFLLHINRVTKTKPWLTIWSRDYTRNETGSSIWETGYNATGNQVKPLITIVFVLPCFITNAWSHSVITYFGYNAKIRDPGLSFYPDYSALNFSFWTFSALWDFSSKNF